MKKVFVIVGVVVVVGAGALWYFRGADAGVKTYTSQKLGVKFQYNSKPHENMTAGVKESGNKIYVYAGTMAPESGQSVEVFAKRADETLEQSIRRQILADYPSSVCRIEIAPSNIQGGYQVAEISYPRSSDTEDPWFSNYQLCNPGYDKTNGIRYFLYDPKHADMFVFLSIGQYAIPAHDLIPWQDTLTFLP
jgi:hypothetical protein